MNVKQLNRYELTELKQTYFCDKNNSVSWAELANIDEFVTDEEIFETYGLCEFAEDDFFCNSNGRKDSNE